MGFRFRKSVNIGPLRLNFSKSGVGYSFGVRGLRYTKKANGGTRLTSSVPGTGLSYVAETGAKKSAASSNGGGSLFKPLLGSVAAVLVLVLGLVGCMSNDSSPAEQIPANSPAAKEAEILRQIEEDAAKPAVVEQEKPAQSEEAEPVEEPEPEEEPAPQVEEKKVYRTKSGKRYHYSDNCNGGTYYETTLEKALKAGLTPCEKCVG